MLFGVIIVNIFAAVWCELGMSHLPMANAARALPPMISLWLVVAGARALRRLPARDRAEAKRIGRLIGIWAGAEGAAMLVTAPILGMLGLQADILPALAIIVGLHFVPLAHGIPCKPYYAVAAAMILAAAVALALPAADRAPVSGIASGVALWVSVVLRIRQEEGRVFFFEKKNQKTFTS
jgi:hypothetical protein